MGYWVAIKTFFQSWKLWTYVVIALAIALWSFQHGKESCQEKAYEALEREIDKINDRAAKAVKQAAKDARNLQEAKEKNDEQVDEARDVASGNCTLLPDELHVLQSIQERTKSK